MNDMTGNAALALYPQEDPPTLSDSISAWSGKLPLGVSSDTYSVYVTQDDVPIVWPHLHTYEMNEVERQVLHKALRASVKFVGVGDSI